MMNKILFLAGFQILCLAAMANSNKATTQESDPDSDGVKASYATKPYLKITSPKLKREFSLAELLNSPFLKKVKVEKDPAYKNESRTYSAVPASELFKDFKIADSTTIAFFCLDGFSAPISAERVLNTDPKKSIAYIALETVNDPWPAIKSKDGKSAGPYYLIWENPEKSKISQEEWPFQLAGFEIKGTLAEQFPHTVPDTSIKEDLGVMKGYRSFMKNCFACHSLNGEGLAHMGPDLNIPYNPTEYLKPEYLETLIRKPANLRLWTGSKMSSFSKENLPDDELKNLILYLQYMAKHKLN